MYISWTLHCVFKHGICFANCERADKDVVKKCMSQRVLSTCRYRYLNWREWRKTESLDTWQSAKGKPYCRVASISRSVWTNEHACTWWDRARRAGHVSNILPREFFLFNWFNRRKTRRDRLQTPRGFSRPLPLRVIRALPTANRCNETPEPTPIRIETPTPLRG